MLNSHWIVQVTLQYFWMFEPLLLFPSAISSCDIKVLCFLRSKKKVSLQFVSKLYLKIHSNHQSNGFALTSTEWTSKVVKLPKSNRIMSYIQSSQSYMHWPNLRMRHKIHRNYTVHWIPMNESTSKVWARETDSDHRKSSKLCR